MAKKIKQEIITWEKMNELIINKVLYSLENKKIGFTPLVMGQKKRLKRQHTIPKNSRK